MRLARSARHGPYDTPGRQAEMRSALQEAKLFVDLETCPVWQELILPTLDDLDSPQRATEPNIASTVWHEFHDSYFIAHEGQKENPVRLCSDHAGSKRDIKILT